MEPARIPADPAYIAALGQAFYNFTYLEWGVIWTIAKLSADGFESVPRGQTATYIAKALIQAVDSTQPPLSPPLRKRLAQLHTAYGKAIGARNKLLHAHPFSAPDGSQRITGGGHEWPIEKVSDVAKEFENLAIECNDIFWGPLAIERP